MISKWTWVFRCRDFPIKRLGREACVLALLLLCYPLSAARRQCASMPDYSNHLFRERIPVSFRFLEMKAMLFLKKGRAVMRVRGGGGKVGSRESDRERDPAADDLPEAVWSNIRKLIYHQDRYGKNSTGPNELATLQGKIDEDLAQAMGAAFGSTAALESRSEHELHYGADRKDHRLHVWAGNRARLQIFNTERGLAPFARVGLEGLGQREVKGLAAGARHLVVCCKDGTILTAGSNEFGQRGVGFTWSDGSKEDVGGVGGATSRETSRMEQENADGQKRSRSETQEAAKVSGLSAVDLPGDGRIRKVSCGSFHSVVVTEGGAAWGWGDNRAGQLGLSRIKIVAAPAMLRVGQAWWPEQAIVDAACGDKHTVRALFQAALAPTRKRPWSDCQYHHRACRSCYSHQAPSSRVAQTSMASSGADSALCGTECLNPESTSE